MLLVFFEKKKIIEYKNIVQTEYCSQEERNKINYKLEIREIKLIKIIPIRNLEQEQLVYKLK
jgi:hypothetical protein